MTFSSGLNSIDLYSHYKLTTNPSNSSFSSSYATMSYERWLDYKIYIRLPFPTVRQLHPTYRHNPSGLCLSTIQLQMANPIGFA